MEKKDMQQPISEELKDELLDAVTGGYDLEPYDMNALYYMRDPNERMEEIKKMIEAEKPTLSKMLSELHADSMSSVMEECPTIEPAMPAEIKLRK